MELGKWVGGGGGGPVVRKRRVAAGEDRDEGSEDGSQSEWWIYSDAMIGRE
jgi:hypothetical protein